MNSVFIVKAHAFSFQGSRDMVEKQVKTIETEEEIRIPDGTDSGTTVGEKEVGNYSTHDVSPGLASTAFEELLEDHWSRSEYRKHQLI